MSSKQQSWLDFVTEASVQPIKDETFDCDVIEISPPLTDTIDYTIIDSKIDQLHSNNHHSVETTSLKETNGKIKKSRKKTVTTESKLDFS